MQTLQKAGSRHARQINNGLVLRTIYDRGPVSRADVARATGLTRTTVSDVVEELMQLSLLVEVGRGQSTGGKAPILLEVPDDARHLIGVDVGDGRLAGAVVDLRGRVRHRIELPFDGRDGALALERLEDLTDELVAAAEAPLLGIGVGTPGLIDTSSGTVRWAVNLDWRDLPLGARLHARYGLPAYVANDSQAAAMGEFTFGGHPSTGSMLVVRVSQGVGAGIVLNGQLFQGDGFGAGEVGHSAVADNHRPCRCGSAGCLETIASSRAVVQRARELAVHAPESVLHVDAPDSIDLERLVDAFEQRDEVAREVVLAAAHHLGRMIGGLIGALNVQRIVVTGVMTRFGEPWLSAVRREAHRSALALLTDETSIEVGRLGSDIVVLGAAALLMSRELGVAPLGAARG